MNGWSAPADAAGGNGLITPFKHFLIDLDDTLVEERDYVLSGFRAVAAFIAPDLGIPADEAYAFMRTRLDQAGRERMFDALLTTCTGNAPAERVRELVEVYRGHRPELSLYPGAGVVLDLLRQRGRVVIVTDGLTTMQERKVEALGLADRVDDIVYCHRTGHPKPDPGSLMGVVEQGQGDVVIIGDRPDHDLALAARHGLAAIRVRTGRFHAAPNAPWQPIADIEAFAQLARESEFCK